ncbi:MAG: hypothetical protein LPK14_12855 [Hymenobacteraceae bacterium]|nr:hypothetical protein [Hymenobacteraceae bacterium]MDX5423138.1 hypothetical protein [Hymenobacteraceae bacterium]
MVSKSAKQAVSDVLQVELNEKQSHELYYKMCDFLMSKDDISYLDIVKFKYSLLYDDFNQELVDYFVMEYVLDKMTKKHPLILSTLTYIIVNQS